MGRLGGGMWLKAGGGGLINLRVLKSRKTDMQCSKTAD